MIVKYMRENRVLKAPDGNVALNELSNGETWEKYIRRMRQDGAWGDHLVLIAAALLFRVTITVISTASDQPVTIGVCQDTISNIFIFHICELHYVSLCDIDETDHGRTQLEGQCTATLKDHMDMETYHFCGNEDDHNKRSNESHIISLGKPHSPSELDQNDTIPFQPHACSSPNTCLKAPTILGSSNGSNNRSFYGPIRHYEAEKYHDYIPSKILDGCLVSNFNDMALLQSSPNMHFSTIYVQPFLNYAYSCDLNENGQMAQNEINPNVFNFSPIKLCCEKRWHDILNDLGMVNAFAKWEFLIILLN